MRVFMLILMLQYVPNKWFPCCKCKRLNISCLISKDHAQVRIILFNILSTEIFGSTLSEWPPVMYTLLCSDVDVLLPFLYSGNIRGVRPYLTGDTSCSACPQDLPYCTNNLCCESDTVCTFLVSLVSCLIQLLSSILVLICHSCHWKPSTNHWWR